MPPQNIDAERSVLGAMLLNSDAVGAAIEVLRENAADAFYAEAHQHIYGAMVALFRKNVPIDPVTLTEQLSRAGHLESVGGVSYVADLSSAVPTSANVDYYARIVLDAAVLRKLISACTQLAGEAYSLPPDTNALLDRAESHIFAIAEARQLTPIHRVGDLLEDSIHRIEAIIKAHDGITGLATGFAKLDEMLSGLQPSDMVVLAARPSVGKTAFALNMASHIAIHLNKSALIFSLEMSKEQLVQRLLCMEGQIDSRRLRTGYLAQSEFPKLTRAADKLSRAPIYIDDTPRVTVLDLKSKARRHKSTHGLDLIIIDYMQLMGSQGRAENRQTEISDISRSIKGIARELRIPVVALSQLSREAEKDDSGGPKLSHLRESGAIEQDADVVLMLSRPPAHEAEGNENLIRLDIAKQRNGPTGKIELLFDRNIQRFKSVMPGGEAAHISPSAEEASYDAEDIYTDDDTPF
ncbi:MAG: replicative DNA helicase [Candidatus Hydrogenedentes bacterium]|nr:replicative DNA helicase [Candidatus Hydrogenedentota bacterium]